MKNLIIFASLAALLGCSAEPAAIKRRTKRIVYSQSVNDENLIEVVDSELIESNRPTTVAQPKNYMYSRIYRSS